MGDSGSAKQYGWVFENPGKGTTFSAIRHEVDEKELFPFYQLAANMSHATSFAVNHPLFQRGDFDNTNMIGTFEAALWLPHDLTVSTMCKFADAISDVFLSESDAKLVNAMNIGVMAHCRIKPPTEEELKGV
jgi:hypothetical protein